MSMAGLAGGAEIAGFWRRIGAAVIDALILAVPAYFIGYQFFDELMALGQNGRFIGAAASLIYFGVLNSSLGGGQSFGKRVLGIRVVGASGEPVGLPRAVVRALILMLPWYLNGFDMTPFAGDDDQRTVMLLSVCASFVVFGLGFAMVYLYIFNRKTRQSLHDLFVESYVVKAEPAGAVAPRVWPVHVAIAVLLMAGGLALPAYFWRLASDMAQSADKGGDETFEQLRGIEHAVEALANVGRVTVSENAFTINPNSGDSTTTRTLELIVYVKKRTEETDALLSEIAKAVLKRSPDILGNDQLRITIAMEFDIGLFRASESVAARGTAEQWRQRLEGEEKEKFIEVTHSSDDSFRSAIEGAIKLFVDTPPPKTAP